ncbi:hypothetical protein WA026_023738 [Henosepilachna vigintioctopunctata]|uniref:Uncharacterized protein n=1 Tax=Henosepilachna vigintioctopunctata TaxID=420089 RepID=A0AAW1UC87_9CUCU
MAESCDDSCVNLDEENLSTVINLLKVVIEKCDRLESENAEMKKTLNIILKQNEKIDKLVEEDHTHNNRQEGKINYAQGVKKSKHEIIIFESKNTKFNDSQQTIVEIKSTIDPAELNIGVNGMKNMENGKIGIFCENKKDVQVLKKEVERKLGHNYET